jgi:hypothetical protein
MRAIPSLSIAGSGAHGLSLFVDIKAYLPCKSPVLLPAIANLYARSKARRFLPLGVLNLLTELIRQNVDFSGDSGFRIGEGRRAATEGEESGGRRLDPGRDCEATPTRIQAWESGTLAGGSG